MTLYDNYGLYWVYYLSSKIVAYFILQFGHFLLFRITVLENYFKTDMYTQDVKNLLCTFCSAHASVILDTGFWCLLCTNDSYCHFIDIKNIHVRVSLKTINLWPESFKVFIWKWGDNINYEYWMPNLAPLSGIYWD